MAVDLKDAFGFTTDELALNKSGQLSRRQRAQAVKQANRKKVTSVILALVAGAIAIYSLLPFVRTFSMAGGVDRLIGGSVFAVLSLLFFTALWQKPALDVQHVQGKVQFVRRDSDVVEDDNRVITTTTYYLVIGEQEFAIDRSKYEAFDQGHVYAIYYLTPAQGILSAEYIGPPGA